MYTIRAVSDTEFKIASFGDHKHPDNIYTVHINKNSYWCSCPGYARMPGAHHKHVKIVHAWIRAGAPWLCSIKLEGTEIIIKDYFKVDKEK